MNEQNRHRPLAIHFPPECAWLFAILTGEVPPDGDEDKLFALAEVHNDLHGKLNTTFQAMVADALGYTKQNFDGDAAKMYQEAMKAFLGGQEGLDYFKAVGDQAQLVAEFTRKSATQLQYTKYMIIAQLIALLIEAAVAAATAFFFGASIGAYLQKQAIVRMILKTWIGRMIVTLLTHQVINVGMGVAMDSMVQWIQLNQGTRDEWDTELTKNAALSGMVQGLLAGPFNALGNRFGKLLAKMFGLDSGRNLGNKIDGVVPPPKNRPEVEVKVPDVKPPSPSPSPSPSPRPKTETEIPSPSPSPKPKAEAEVPAPGPKEGVEVPEPGPKPGEGRPETEKPDARPPVSFGRDMSEAFRKNLPNTYGPNGAKAGDKFVKDVGEVFRRQYGDGAVDAGRDWARALLEKTGTRELPDALEKALGPIAKDLGPDVMKVLSQGAADSMGRSIMREIAEGTGRGIFEGAHAAVSEGMYNLIFSDEHTFKTSGLTFASGMAEGRLGAMMETGGENLAMGLRGNLGMGAPSWLTEGTGAPPGSAGAAPAGGNGDTATLSSDDGDDGDTISLIPLDDDEDSDTTSLASLDDDEDGDTTSLASRDTDSAFDDDFAYDGDGSDLANLDVGDGSVPPPVTTAPVPTTGSPSPTAPQTPNQPNQQTNQSTQTNQSSNQAPPRTTPGNTTNTETEGQKPTTLSTESTAPNQDQSLGSDRSTLMDTTEDDTESLSPPLTESTTPAEGDSTTEAPHANDNKPEPDSRSATTPATVSNEDVQKTESGRGNADNTSVPRTVDATTAETMPRHTSPRPDSESETAAARTGKHDSEFVSPPLFPPSFSPPKNDPDEGAGAQHTRGTSSASALQSSDGVMSLKQFQDATSTTGFRSKSEIGKVDEALRQFKSLGNTGAMDQLLALSRIVRECDTYINHKGDKGTVSNRVLGVQQLSEQAKAQKAHMASATLFRDLLTETDRTLGRGENPDLDNRVLGSEAQGVARALTGDEFKTLMDGYVDDLRALQHDPTLPEITRNVIQELMDVVPLVTVMEYPKTGNPGMKLIPGAPSSYSFNVDTQARGGTSFLLGHMAHEFTHVAAHRAFSSSAVMELVRSDSTDQQVKELAAERKQTLAALNSAREGNPAFGDFQQNMLQEKLVYGSQPYKLARYATNFGATGKISPDEKARLLRWDEAAGDASGTLVEYDTVLNQMLVYLHMWGTAPENTFYTRLREAAETAYERRESSRRAPVGPTTVPTTSGAVPPPTTTNTETTPHQGDSAAPIHSASDGPLRTSSTSAFTTRLTHEAGTVPSTPQASARTPVPPTTQPVATTTADPQQSAGPGRAALAYQLLTSSSSIPPAPTPPPVRSPEESAPAPLPTGKRPAPPVDPSLPRVPAERVDRPATAEELAAFGDAAWAKVSTERFDPVRVQSNQRRGLLDGSATLIRHQVRREDLGGGRAVRHFRLDLPFRPLNGLDVTDLKALETRLQNVLDSTVNSGYKLPASGDQLRVTLRFRPDPGNGEAISLTRDRKPDRANQIRWDLGHDDGTLVHELLHYLGLPDEYLDTRNGRKSENPHVFRSDERLSGVRRDGLMATAERADLDALPADYLKRIEEVSDTALIPTHTRQSSAEAAPPRSSDNTDGHNSPPLHPASAIPPEVTPRLSEVLPREDWWTLFFDPTDHETARREHPDDPGSYYDNDESPGFREGMINAYNEALENPGFVLDATSYERLHTMAVASLGHIPPRTGGESRTKYPLRSEEVSVEVADMTIGGRALLVDAQKAFVPFDAELFARGRAAVSVIMPSGMDHVQVTANYSEADWSPLLNTIFAEYNADIATAVSNRQRMLAIAKTITKLQVMHPFQDGNRRVNVHVVLPRLLLENGFDLVMSPEMRSMFQGGTSLTRQVEILMATADRADPGALPADTPTHPTSASPENNDGSGLDLGAQPKPDDTRTLLEPAQKRVRDSSSTGDDDRDPPQRPRLSGDSPPAAQEPQPDAPVGPEAGAGDASDGSAAVGSSGGPVTRKLSDILPESDWWKLFLDPVHHEEAQKKHPEDPGSYYDNDQSPGFRVGMLKAYKEALENPDFVLNSHTYESLHTKAVESLTKPPKRTQASPATMFPLRAKEMSEDTDKMTILGRKLLLDFKKYDWNQKADAPKPVSVLRMPSRFGNSDELITTNYKPEEWSDLLNAIFADYGKEIDAAVDDRAKMAAIARVVTKLQIMHPFGDGNRRLNVHVILPRLLLENNFRPVISPEMKHMFQGGTDVNKQVDILMQSQI
ncbi:hypothetical protein [Streptomyces tsukubensis]|uniref:WXG100-like domain-containing protein n=1 Tax=Streptomyces tsukubensis TaxID=83656 RepID=UPI00344F6B9C